jgi:phage terminase small subunit
MPKKTTKRKTAKKDLTPKMQLFVAEYLKDLNATQAAIRAGYSKKTAHVQGPRLLDNVRIQEAIESGIETLVERIAVDQDFVIEGLVKNYERAMQEVEATDKEGNPLGYFLYQGNVANKSLELLGRHLAMFTDKIQVSQHEDSLDDLE